MPENINSDNHASDTDVNAIASRILNKHIKAFEELELLDLILEHVK